MIGPPLPSVISAPPASEEMLKFLAVLLVVAVDKSLTSTKVQFHIYISENCEYIINGSLQSNIPSIQEWTGGLTCCVNVQLSQTCERVYLLWWRDTVCVCVSLG